MEIYHALLLNTCSVKQEDLTPLWNIESTNDNNIWVTSQKGLAKIKLKDNSTQVFKHEPDNPYSLPNNNVFCTTTDQRGITWIGTWDGGLSVFNPLNNKFKYTNNDGVSKWQRIASIRRVH